MPPTLPPGTTRIFPTQLQIGGRMTDSTGEWEVIGRPYTTAGGKNAHVRVQRADQPGVTETKLAVGSSAPFPSIGPLALAMQVR